MRNKFFTGTLVVLSFLYCLFFLKTERSLANYDTQRGITNVVISNITQTSAKITFNTAISQKTSVICSIDCGRYNDYTNRTVHSFTIQNLSPGTEYSLSIIRDNDLDSINTEHYHFKTLLILTRFTPQTMAIIDTTKPVISNVVVSQVTTSSARITWKTDENSSTTVVLSGGGQAGRIFTNSDQNSVTQHSINVNNLNTFTIYSYVIKSKDGSGNEAATTASNFSTLGIPLTISNVRASDISSTSVRIKWETNKNSTSRVGYAVKNSNNSLMVKNDSAVTQHNLSVNDLKPNTKYIYRVESADSDGIYAYGTMQEFKTLSLEDESLADSSVPGSSTSAGSQTSGQTSSTPGTAEELIDVNQDGSQADLNNMPATNSATASNEILSTNSTEKANSSFLSGLLSGLGSATVMLLLGFFLLFVIIIIASIVIIKLIFGKKNLNNTGQNTAENKNSAPAEARPAKTTEKNKK